MKKLSKDQWMGIIRHALTFIGGILIAKGAVNDSSWAEIAGSAMSLVGAIWSVWDKA